MPTRRTDVAATLAVLANSSAMNLDTLKTDLLGNWASFATELRPSGQKNADGSPQPFYLRRAFSALPGDRFALTITTFADSLGQVPMARLRLAGHMLWRGPHPVAVGAQQVDFIADEAYDVTPLLPGFVQVLNQVAADGYAPWAVGVTQSVFGKNFAPFGLEAGRNFMEYDLVHLHEGLLFWGARHVDGRGFDSESKRPTNLQIPMMKA